ncbi:MAG: DUF1579 family protein [Deltaproteobacteria bacterium]|nr:DUF1579 family protein [Deltaproteobacteria bacterium]MCW5803650.1 DUF1579 family protein [Deltaproteobacteria bacterium]
MKILSLVSFTALITAAGLATAGDPKADKPAAPKAAEMQMPTPPAQIAEMGKTMNGTWKCKGSTSGPDGKPSPMEATSKSSTSPDGWWLVETMDAKSGPMKFNMQSYMTFDAASKKWRRVSVDSMGTSMVGTADASKDGKMSWTFETQGPMGAGTFKDEVDASDLKKGLKLAGKMSMDKGKTWMPVYEMTCTK